MQSSQGWENIPCGACGKPSGRITIQALGILEQGYGFYSREFIIQLLRKSSQYGIFERGMPNDQATQIVHYELGSIRATK